MANFVVMTVGHQSVIQKYPVWGEKECFPLLFVPLTSSVSPSGLRAPGDQGHFPPYVCTAPCTALTQNSAPRLHQSTARGNHCLQGTPLYRASYL